MTGNPYHDAAGKFCGKDTAMKSYEIEIIKAIQSGDSERARNLQTDYENMMIEADPQSEVAQKALKRDYGTFNKSSKKQDREEKKREKTIMKANQNTIRFINRFNNEVAIYAKKYNLPPKEVSDEWAKSRKMDQDPIGLIHPDYIVKPEGKYKEIPQSDVREGDIVNAVATLSINGPFSQKINVTGRIATFGDNDKYIEFYDPATKSRSFVVSNSIEKLRDGQEDMSLTITSIVRDEGAEEFLKEHEKNLKQKKDKQNQIK